MVETPAQSCPECGSKRLYRDGLRCLADGDSVQRWLCRDCGFRFSQSGYTSSNKSQYLSTVDRQSLNRGSALLYRRQVCDPLQKELINLATVEPQLNGLAGATTDVKGKLLEFSWYMHKQGFKPATIKGRLDCLSNLRRVGANIFDPEDVKGLIADQKWGDGYKKNVVLAYTTFLCMLGKTWNRPRYKPADRLPFIPTEHELDQLISSVGKRTSIFLETLKETGADPGEAAALEWQDINEEKRAITINRPVKGHKARMISVSRQLIDRLSSLPRTQKTVFKAKLKSLEKNLFEQRKTAARKLGNPRLLEICFTTFRHWKATIEYHKTKDILWVMRLLGHNSLKTTLIYIDIEAALFKETDDEFTVKVADTVQEACKLLEVGFEHVCDMDGKGIFRKRK